MAPKKVIKLKDMVGKRVKLLSTSEDWSGTGVIVVMDLGYIGFHHEERNQLFYFNSNSIVGFSEVIDEKQ